MNSDDASILFYAHNTIDIFHTEVLSLLKLISYNQLKRLY